MWEVLGKKRLPHAQNQEPELYEIAESEEAQSDRMNNWKNHQAERAMANFKAKGNLDGEVERANALFAQTQVPRGRQPRPTAHFERFERPESVSSDSSIEKLVNNGVEQTFKIAKQTAFELNLPYVVSFMLSLSSSQLSKLQKI